MEVFDLIILNFVLRNLEKKKKKEVYFAESIRKSDPTSEEGFIDFHLRRIKSCVMECELGWGMRSTGTKRVALGPTYCHVFSGHFNTEFISLVCILTFIPPLN